MSKAKENAIGGLIVGGVVMFVLSLIVKDPNINPFWRKTAQTIEGDIYRHVITGDLITVLA